MVVGFGGFEVVGRLGGKVRATDQWVRGTDHRARARGGRAHGEVAPGRAGIPSLAADIERGGGAERGGGGDEEGAHAPSQSNGWASGAPGAPGRAVPRRMAARAPIRDHAA